MAPCNDIVGVGVSQSMRRIYYWNMENSMYRNYRARKEVDEAVIHFHPGIALRGRGKSLLIKADHHIRLDFRTIGWTCRTA